MIKRILHVSIIWILLAVISSAFSKNDRTEVGVDEKLGDFLPMELEFFDSNGDTVKLADVIDKPVLLALVYYECPGICSPLLTELAWVVDKVDLQPEEDFKVVTISIAHKETPEIAANWKKNYFAAIKRPFPQDAWTFLVGDSVNIKKVADALGYYFKPVGDEYVHPGALVTISPKGKISRYLFGTTFNPFDVKMALIDAKAGKTNPTIAKVLEFCFSYDPEGRGYTLNVTRIIGTIMLFGVGIFLTILIVKKKKNKFSKG